MTDSEIDVFAINAIEHLGKDKDHNIFKVEVGADKPFAIAFSDAVSAKFLMHLIDTMRKDGKKSPQARVLAVGDDGEPNYFPCGDLDAVRIDERLYLMELDIGDGLRVPIQASRVDIRRMIDRLSRVIDAPLSQN